MGYRFKDMGRALNKIAQKLNKNQDIKKLLKEMGPNPLSAETQDIEVSLINKNIRITPDVDFTKMTEAFIVITIPTFELDANIDFTSVTVAIDVLCPASKWLIDDICPRPFKIMESIEEELEGSRVTGIGTMNLVGGDMTVPYAGITDHQMVFEVTANG